MHNFTYTRRVPHKFDHVGSYQACIYIFKMRRHSFRYFDVFIGTLIYQAHVGGGGGWGRPGPGEPYLDRVLRACRQLGRDVRGRGSLT